MSKKGFSFCYLLAILPVTTETTEARLFAQEPSSAHRIGVHLYRNWVRHTGSEFISTETEFGPQDRSSVRPIQFLIKSETDSWQDDDDFLYSFWRNSDGSRWTKNLCVVELDSWCEKLSLRGFRKYVRQALLLHQYMNRPKSYNACRYYPALSQIYPHWNWNSKLNTKLSLEFQFEYGFLRSGIPSWIVNHLGQCATQITTVTVRMMGDVNLFLPMLTSISVNIAKIDRHI